MSNTRASAPALFSVCQRCFNLRADRIPGPAPCAAGPCGCCLWFPVVFCSHPSPPAHPRTAPRPTPSPPPHRSPRPSPLLSPYAPPLTALSHDREGLLLLFFCLGFYPRHFFFLDALFSASLHVFCLRRVIFASFFSGLSVDGNFLFRLQRRRPAWRIPSPPSAPPSSRQLPQHNAPFGSPSAPDHQSASPPQTPFSNPSSCRTEPWVSAKFV